MRFIIRLLKCLRNKRRWERKKVKLSMQYVEKSVGLYFARNERVMYSLICNTRLNCKWFLQFYAATTVNIIGTIIAYTRALNISRGEAYEYAWTDANITVYQKRKMSTNNGKIANRIRCVRHATWHLTGTNILFLFIFRQSQIWYFHTEQRTERCHAIMKLF